jgi:hypothetical protein
MHLHPVSQHYRSHSGSSIKSQTTVTDKRGNRPGQRSPGHRDVSGRSKPEKLNDTSSENSSEKSRARRKAEHEVDEFEARENLVAWRLPSRVA